MELKIYNKSGNLILTASPNTSSSLTEEIGGECSVSASFTHTSFILLDVDSYIEIEGVRYKVKSRYRPKQKDTQTYEYSVKFYAPIHDAEDVLMLFTEGDITSEFNYDGGPREHLQLWIDNMNRLAGTNVWSIGTVISAENKTIEYKNLKCWDAAFGSNGIAATFETEMWADGYVINLCKAERGEIVELGYLQGLTNLAQEDNGEVKFFTRLFPLGSTRNIDATKYGYSRLQLPSRAMYVDKNVDLYGVKEETEEAAFSEIFPKYIGTVSSVRTEEKTNEEGREYTVYYFKDDGMNWNPKDYEIPDLDYMLQFQTGELVGRGTDGSFQAAWHEDTNEWEIINVYPDDTTQIPGDVIIPKPGDTYIPWNFSMPQEYVTAAEQAYEQAVNNFLSSYSFDPNKYTGTTDRNYIERNATPLRIGWNVRLLSEQYFSTTGGYKDTRITKVQRKLNDLCQATITCTDQVGTTWKTSVNNQLNNLQYVLSKQEQQAIIDIIKTTDSKTPSDYNVLSALKAIGMFHRKDKTDENSYLQKFLKGIELGKFVSGLLGTGGAILIDEDGNSHAEFDYLNIRKKALFTEITVQELKHIGGALIISPAAMIISSVEETDEGYKCYFDKKNSDGKTIYNEFEPGDQGRCQTFNLEKQENGQVGNRYWWRLVIATGDDYVVFSKTDADTGSDIPAAGDEVAQLGNRTDKTRQNAQIYSAYGSDSPSRKMYQGIDSYNLVGKIIKDEYFDVTTGRFKEVTYGDAYYGDPERKSYIEHTIEKGVDVDGRVHIQSGSTGAENLEDLPDEIYKAVKIGGENLLKNTAFRGDYQSLELDSSTALKSATDLYSPKLTGWSGSAVVLDSEEEDGVFACKIGNISQEVSLTPEENYVFTAFAKGVSITMSCGGVSLTQALTSEYALYTFSFAYHSGISFSLSGDATIKKLKLARGSIATDWCPHVTDDPEITDRFKSLWYIQHALREGVTDIYGGLILTEIIQLGEYIDGVMKKVTAGISGIYNDDTDVAVWAGGSYEDAIRTVQTLLSNPNYQPSDEEWKSMAKFVATHGGDSFFRGFIYALGGIFRGRVETNINGRRIVIDPSDNSLRMYDANGKICLDMSFVEEENGRIFSGITVTEYEGETPFFTSTLSGRRLSFDNLIENYGGIISPDRIFFSNQRSTIFDLKVSTLTTGEKVIDMFANRWSSDSNVTEGHVYVDETGTMKVGGYSKKEGYTGDVLVHPADKAADRIYLVFENGIMVGTKNG